MEASKLRILRLAGQSARKMHIRLKQEHVVGTADAKHQRIIGWNDDKWKIVNWKTKMLMGRFSRD